MNRLFTTQTSQECENQIEAAFASLFADLNIRKNTLLESAKSEATKKGNFQFLILFH